MIELIVKPSCTAMLRRIAELWLPKSVTGDDGDSVGYVMCRRKVDFDHSCRYSIWRKYVNGGGRAALTDEDVQFEVKCIGQPCGKSGDAPRH